MSEVRHLYFLFKENREFDRYFAISDGLRYRGGQSELVRAFNYSDYSDRNKTLEDMGFTLKNILPLAFWE